MKKILVLAAAVAVSAFALSANAATVSGVYNTGVDNAGNRLAEGATDTHWTVSPGNAIGAAAASTSALVYDHPAYLQASDAKFVSLQADGNYPTGQNVNTFTLNFNIDGAFSKATLSGLFEADNYATVYLNGVQIAQDIQGTVYPNFQSFTSFGDSLTSDFKVGQNQLQFVVTDTGPPTAMQVSGLTVTASVPEPASWALMIAGLGLVGGSLRTNRKNAVATA